VIQYRSFRNNDPPALTHLWNETFTGRAAAYLRQTAILEYFHLAKPYFDPAGLIVAEENNGLLGMVQAGFGPDESEHTLDYRRGIICLLGVHPMQRGRGIGKRLLERAEEYLRLRGALEIHAGPMAPLNPFTFGLYGGSQSPGFLESDGDLGPFLQKHGYERTATVQVYQRPLDKSLLTFVDTRLPMLRRRFELRTLTRRGSSTWFQECVRGPIDVIEVRLEEKGTGQLGGRLLVWEMDTFSVRWNEHAVGILDVDIREDLRRQGLGKLMLNQVLRFYHDQYFTLAEAQARNDNEAGIAMLKGLGFYTVDQGHQYKRT